MPWKKANKDLINFLEKMMLNYRCDRRVMFGAPTFFVNGNMFACVHEDTIIIRLAELDLKEIFNRFKDVKPFTPMGNHIMKEYAAVPESFVEKPVVLIGHPFQSIMQEEDIPNVITAVGRNVRDGYTFPNGIEFRFRNTSGQ